MGSDGVRRHAIRRDGAVVCLVCAAIVVALWAGCGGEGDVAPPAPRGDEVAPAGALEVLSSAALYEPAPARALRREAEGFIAAGATPSLRSVLPVTADGVLRLDAGEGRWIEILAVGRTAVPGVASDDALVFADAEDDTDVVLVAGPRSVEEHRVLRSRLSPASARYAVKLGPALAALRLADGRIEALDRRGRVAFHTAPALAVDAAGAVRPVQLGVSRQDSWFVTASVDVSGLSYPIAVDPTWVHFPVCGVPRRKGQSDLDHLEICA